MDPPGTRAEMTCIPLHKTWQMTLLLSMDPPGTRVEMTLIPLHKTWQMTLLWPIDPQPPVPEQRCLKYQYTKLGRQTYSDQWTPQYHSRDDLNTTTQKLADEPTLVNRPPRYQCRYDLNTTTQKLADNPTLANGPPSTRAEMP